jgi:tetratricopeptide (TPR) repeat protein
MRYFCAGLVLAYVLTPAFAQEKADGPASEKAQKTYKQALEYLHERRNDAALEEFKKADKQDGGHCVVCQKQILKYGLELQDWKAAEVAAGEIVAKAQGDRDVALAHYQFAIVLMNEGVQRHKDEYSLAPTTRLPRRSPRMRTFRMHCSSMARRSPGWDKTRRQEPGLQSL